MLATNTQDSLNQRLLYASKWVLILLGLLTLVVGGILIFSRSHEKGENYISVAVKAEAKSSGRNPCDILLQWLAEAKQAGNSQRVRDIQMAQKFLGCRNVQKRSEGRLPMSWYAAHAIMVVRYKDSPQKTVPFWENIILIEAESEDEAWSKGIARAKEDEGDSEGSFTWDGRPATWCFAGIRKLVAAPDPDAKPGHGTEITYLEMEVDNEESLARLLDGESVPVRYGF